MNFAGNCEARERYSGDFDAIVRDSFAETSSQNIQRAFAATLMGMLKKELMADTRSKLGAAMAKPGFERLKKVMDYNEYGEAPFGVLTGV